MAQQPAEKPTEKPQILYQNFEDEVIYHSAVNANVNLSSYKSSVGFYGIDLFGSGSQSSIEISEALLKGITTLIEKDTKRTYQ